MKNNNTFIFNQCKNISYEDNHYTHSSVYKCQIDGKLKKSDCYKNCKFFNKKETQIKMQDSIKSIVPKKPESLEDNILVDDTRFFFFDKEKTTAIYTQGDSYLDTDCVMLYFDYVKKLPNSLYAIGKAGVGLTDEEFKSILKLLKGKTFHDVEHRLSHDNVNICRAEM